VWLGSLDLETPAPIDCGLPEDARRDPAKDLSLEDEELEASMSQLRAAVEKHVGPPAATLAPHQIGGGTRSAPPAEDGPAVSDARSRPEDLQEEDITSHLSTEFLSELWRSLGGGKRFFSHRTGNRLLAAWSAGRQPPRQLRGSPVTGACLALTFVAPLAGPRAVNCDARDSRGNAPLHLAAWIAEPEVCNDEICFSS
jgi:hypothetical protein